jgi:hypothetical protein
MISDDIQVQKTKQRTIIQTYYELRYNHNNYTFLDYVYEDNREPVQSGELSYITDHYGKILENEELKETFGSYVDQL